MTESKAKPAVNNTTRILVLILATLVVGAAVGFVTGRQFPALASSPLNIPDFVYVSGTAYAGPNTYGTISIGFGTQCSTHPPAGFALECLWAKFPVTLCPLHGGCPDETDGPYIARIENIRSYRMALSYWGNNTQTQRLTCDAGNLVLNSTSQELTDQIVQCKSGPELIYAFS